MQPTQQIGANLANFIQWQFLVLFEHMIQWATRAQFNHQPQMIRRFVPLIEAGNVGVLDLSFLIELTVEKGLIKKLKVQSNHDPWWPMRTQLVIAARRSFLTLFGLNDSRNLIWRPRGKFWESGKNFRIKSSGSLKRRQNWLCLCGDPCTRCMPSRGRFPRRLCSFPFFIL